VLCIEHDLPQGSQEEACYELMHGRTPKVRHFMSLSLNASFLRKGKSWTSWRLGLSMEIFLVTHLIL
jgi:hypothetical protein